MKVPGFSRSRPSSAATTPVSSPCPSPRGAHQNPQQHLCSEEPHKALRLCLPLSLNRSRSRNRQFSPEAKESSPGPLTPSPLSGRRTAFPIGGGNTPSPSKRMGKTGRLSPQVMAEMKQVFAQFDANGDGNISAEELCFVLRSLGDNVTQEEACRIVAEADLDGDGFISFEEFCDLNMKGLHSGDVQSDDDLTATFNVFDLDRNGHITAEELHSVLFKLGDSSLTVDDCKRMIRGVDTKGAGHVDFDDFKLMMTGV